MTSFHAVECWQRYQSLFAAAGFKVAITTCWQQAGRVKVSGANHTRSYMCLCVVYTICLSALSCPQSRSHYTLIHKHTCNIV